jgi:hypothetical protein
MLRFGAGVILDLWCYCKSIKNRLLRLNGLTAQLKKRDVPNSEVHLRGYVENTAERIILSPIDSNEYVLLKYASELSVV